MLRVMPTVVTLQDYVIANFQRIGFYWVSQLLKIVADRLCRLTASL